MPSTTRCRRVRHRQGLRVVVLAVISLAGSQQPQPRLEPLILTQLDDQRRLPDLDETTVSVRFAEPVAIQDLLLQLVRGTSLSIVPDPAVSGTFVGELKNVTIRQALDHVLGSRALDYRTDGSVIRVFPRAVETRVFEVDYVPTRRSVRRTVATSASGSGSQAQASSVDEQDFFTELSQAVRVLLSDRGTFNLDRKAGLLQVTDFPDRLETVRTYLDRVADRVNEQVQIEARVVRVRLRDEFRAGIDWTAVLETAGRGPTRAPIVGPVRLADFSQVLSALSRQGDVTVLATSTVLAINGEALVLHVGRQDAAFAPEDLRVTSPQLESAAVAGRAAERFVLTVTPQVSAGGVISMSLTPSVRARADDAPARQAVPLLEVSETDTVLRVRDGETVILAGYLGGSGDQTTELVILLTPRIVHVD
jgi:MSHA biogenesis protein MshL